MDAWERQRSLAKGTVVWAAASIATGVVFVSRPDPWWRGFGQQHIGWGVIDLAIVGVVQMAQGRRLKRLPDPYGAATLQREGRRLRTILLVNAALDIGYCVVGAVLRQRSEQQVAGAGSAIIIQGAFLLLHDSHHAFRLRA